MLNNVRVAALEIKNLKNVVSGEVTFPISKSKSFNHADVLGIYGQNGSGKTAVIEAFEILHTLLNGEKLTEKTHRLINQDSDTTFLSFTFLIELGNSSYEVYYGFELSKFHDGDFINNVTLDNEQSKVTVYVSKEELKYKALVKGARPKTAIQFYRTNEEDYSLAPLSLYNKLKSGKNDYLVSYKVNSQLAFKEHTSFFFRKEGMELLNNILNREVFQIFYALKNIFANNLFILNNQQSSLVLANILIPVHHKKKSGFGYEVTILPSNASQKMSTDRFDMLNNMFNAISKVLKELVPELTVELRSLGNETLKDSTIGVRAELVAIREGRSLPISSESDGIKKLISILSSLIVMYNDSNACVVIDELDAGIFEFLLGEIVKILNDSGKGQLLFTSHNLRLLEVLNKENLVFTSTNPEKRFINLKGIKDTNNIRDVYIRAIQLGNDEESVYETTDRYYIMDAFEEAGETQHE